MDKQTDPGYGFRTHVSASFTEAIVLVKEALKGQGFGVLSEIDVQKTLKEKTREQIEPYTILGACNPQLASQAIAAEHEIGLLLPCNVLVHECDGRVTAAAQDPLSMIQLAQNEALRPIAEEARQRLQKALDQIGG